MRNVFICVLLAALLTGCASKPALDPEECGPPTGAGLQVRYTRSLAAFSVKPPGAEEFTRVASGSYRAVQAALANAAIVDDDHWADSGGVTELILWAGPGKWAAEWITGTHLIRLLNDGNTDSSVLLSVQPACMPGFVAAMSEGMEGACPVTPAAPVFTDIAPVRGADPFWVTGDGQQAWPAGGSQKRLWRFRGGEGQPEFTITRLDGQKGGSIKTSGAAWNEGHPDGYRSFPSSVTISEPGCWVISGRTGGAAGSVTVQVR